MKQLLLVHEARSPFHYPLSSVSEARAGTKARTKKNLGWKKGKQGILILTKFKENSRINEQRLVNMVDWIIKLLRPDWKARRRRLKSFEPCLSTEKYVLINEKFKGELSVASQKQRRKEFANQVQANIPESLSKGRSRSRSVVVSFPRILSNLPDQKWWRPFNS